MANIYQLEFDGEIIGQYSGSFEQLIDLLTKANVNVTKKEACNCKRKVWCNFEQDFTEKIYTSTASRTLDEKLAQETVRKIKSITEGLKLNQETERQFLKEISNAPNKYYLCENVVIYGAEKEQHSSLEKFKPLTTDIYVRNHIDKNEHYIIRSWIDYYCRYRIKQ